MKSTFIFKLTTCILLFLVTASNSFAQKTSTQSGYWNAGSTWVGGVAPGATDEVVISTGHVVTVSVSATFCNFYVQSGSTLTINSGVTLSALPASCSTSGIAAADRYDNKGTINGAGTFSIGPTNSSGALPVYENNGTISVTNFVINNRMTTSDNINFYNGFETSGTISSTNVTIRNTSGNNATIYNGDNGYASTINSTKITVENLNTSWDSWVSMYNYSGSSVTTTDCFLNNSYTTSGQSYLDNYGTATITNFTTTTASGHWQFYYANNGATLNYSGASVPSSIIMDVNDASNTVNLNSTSATQAIPLPKNYSSGASTNYYNLILNNTYATSPQFTMAGNIAAYNALTLTSGIVNMNSNRFTLGNPAGASGTLTRTSGHFYSGTFRRYFTSGSSPAIGTNAGLFPLGTEYSALKSTSYYRPFWIGATNITVSTDLYMDAAHTFTIPSNYVAASHTDATWGTGTTLQGVSNSYWTTSRTFGSTARTIRFGGTGYGAPTLTDLNAGQASSSAVGTFAAATNAVVAVEVNRTLSTNASIDNNWYIGTKNKTQSPLPIELIDFMAIPTEETVILDWETATEINNDFFVIERSNDGFKFEPILNKKGAGNSYGILNYTQTDFHPLSGVSYYRLKQVDFNGDFKYSKIIAVDMAKLAAASSIYPNPVIDKLFIPKQNEAEDNRYLIFNSLGSLVKVIQQEPTSGPTDVLDISSLSDGLYMIQIDSKSTNHTVNYKFTKVSK